MGAPTNARKGGASLGGDGSGGAAASATVEGDEDGLLDALLGLPAVGAGGGSSSAGRVALKSDLSPTSLSPGDETTARPTPSSEHGHGHDDGRGEDGAPTEPAGVARIRRGAAAGAEGAGGFGTDDGVDGAAASSGGADELEDWLDDMLADA